MSGTNTVFIPYTRVDHARAIIDALMRADTPVGPVTLLRIVTTQENNADMGAVLYSEFRALQAALARQGGPRPVIAVYHRCGTLPHV